MFGEFIKARRVGRGLGLREFCKLFEVDPSNWSKVERGLFLPPQEEERLKKIASILGIDYGSPLWEEMKDLAAIGAGSIPADLMANEKVVNSLPMFFRTMRSEKPTLEELEKLIEIVKKEESVGPQGLQVREDRGEQPPRDS